MKISVIGLGYVGLPLAVAFGRKYEVVGFDINQLRINELRDGVDRTNEIDKSDLDQAKKLIFSADLNSLKDCDIHIITVPTPIDQYKIPDLSPLIKASESIGKIIKKGAIVVYESTVYPGCTEEDCIPVIEKISGLKFNVDFFAGYSPERINPGDKQRTVTKIKKVVAGSNQEVSTKLVKLYGEIIEAGIFNASSIKVAEAAKVIENTQRDLNIAFVNELSLIFNKMNLDTLEVLEAAGTKWNFLPFKPGLVGGHCIGVDPYYLTYKAQSLGYHPEVILAGRRINDGMGAFVSQQLIKLMIKKGHKIENAKVLVLGVTFKENCKDIRNSKVIDVINELKDFSCQVDVADPLADSEEVFHEYNFHLKDIAKLNWSDYDGVVLAVAHSDFNLVTLRQKLNPNTVVYDVKGVMNRTDVDGRL